MLREDQKRASLVAPCVPLKFLLRPEQSVKNLNGMGAFSDSAYFHRMHDLLFWPLNDAEVTALLSDDERDALADFNREFDSLSWRVIADHPHISELPDDDLSPLVQPGERLLRLLEARNRRTP